MKPKPYLITMGDKPKFDCADVIRAIRNICELYQVKPSELSKSNEHHRRHQFSECRQAIGYYLRFQLNISDERIAELFGYTRHYFIYSHKIIQGFIDVYPQKYNFLTKRFDPPKKRSWIQRIFG